MWEFEIQARLRLIAGLGDADDAAVTLGDFMKSRADQSDYESPSDLHQRAQRQACEDIGNLLWSLKQTTFPDED